MNWTPRFNCVSRGMSLKTRLSRACKFDSQEDTLSRSVAVVSSVDNSKSVRDWVTYSWWSDMEAIVVVWAATGEETAVTAWFTKEIPCQTDEVMALLRSTGEPIAFKQIEDRRWSLCKSWTRRPYPASTSVKERSPVDFNEENWRRNRWMNVKCLVNQEVWKILQNRWKRCYRQKTTSGSNLTIHLTDHELPGTEGQW